MDQKIFNAIDTACEKYVPEELDFLKQLCSINCASGNLEGNAKIIDVMKTMFSSAEVSVEEFYDETVGTHLIARIKPENPDGKVLISAHLDTFAQPDVNVEKYPFRIDGDWVYGIGVADCKGGVVSSFYSIKIMQEAGLLPNKEIVMIYNCDEETGSHSGRKVFEKECVNADMCFVFEPSRNDNSIMTERPGLHVIDIDIKGVTAHPGTSYRSGRSASKELCQQAMRLFDLTDYDNLTVDVCNFRSSDSISGEASCRAVTTLYSAKGIDTFNNVIKEIECGAPFVEDCSCKINTFIFHPPMLSTEKNMAMFEKVHAAGALFGMDYPIEPSTGASDANLISGLYGVPCLDGMGPYMKDIHTFKERMYLPSLKERTLLFALTLADL